ncbi:IclR family transcriptional regulator [Rhodococcus sp. 14C212]|uniref:IclR family transcriptional regulator n=1 Tax=Rhodococcus sp. 14C212 TaxID=2711209 RepID=UPI0013E9F72C|nr:IclR family transcriptional regulator [Rhodococcus sp. 14C212]NGP05781.1 IclR family transcriptional regulator [Rhodococcus sp. 14C212]
MPSTDNAPARGAEHRTVSRVMAILEVVIASEPEGLRLGELSDAIGAPKSSIHGYARGLVATGYLREHEGRYLQGPAVSTLLAIGGQQVPVGYHHALEQLSKACDETAILSMLVGDSAIIVDLVEPTQTIRASPPLHQRNPLWPVSYGKCFLAFMEPRRREAYVRRITDDPAERARITEELATVHDTHIGYNRGERYPDLFGVASPILLQGRDVTMAIGLAGPAARMEAQLDKISKSVLEAAELLSNAGVRG